MEQSFQKELKRTSFLFAIGEVFTKILQYVVSLFLSFFLTTSQTGEISLIKTSALLIIPIVTLDIIESIVNFSADGKHEKKTVFTNGILIGIFGFLLLIPFVVGLDYIFGVSSPIIVYLFISSLMIHNIIHYFLKGIGKTTLYVVNSLLYAIGTCLVTILCLYLFKGGINTYFYCYIGTNVFCVLFMFVSCQLWRYFSFKSFKKSTCLSMAKYSGPLIANTLGWWLISASDIYITRYFLGTSQVGLLTYSHKFPTILSMFYGIFGMSFQLISFAKFDLNTDKGKNDASIVFSEVFKKVVVILGLVLLLIVLITEPVIRFMVNGDYYDSWRYVPLYSLGIFFFCLATFFGYIYNIKKHNSPLLISTIICGICNIFLCILFYLVFKNLFAAALSTTISYFIIFVFRAIHSRKYLKITLPKREMAVLIFLVGIVFINSIIRTDSRTLFAINLTGILLYVCFFASDIIAFLKNVFKRNS